MRPGSRTLEAPRGNRYAPARGMRLMMITQKSGLILISFGTNISDTTGHQMTV